MSSNGHGANIAPIPSHQEVARDALTRYRDIGSRYWAAVAVLGLLSALGLIAFIVRWRVDGFEDRSLWGYHTATMSFLVTCFAAAPVVSSDGASCPPPSRPPLVRGSAGSCASPSPWRRLLQGPLRRPLALSRTGPGRIGG